MGQMSLFRSNLTEVTEIFSRWVPFKFREQDHGQHSKTLILYSDSARI